MTISTKRRPSEEPLLVVGDLPAGGLIIAQWEAVSTARHIIVHQTTPRRVAWLPDMPAGVEAPDAYLVRITNAGSAALLVANYVLRPREVREFSWHCTMWLSPGPVVLNPPSYPLHTDDELAALDAFLASL